MKCLFLEQGEILLRTYSTMLANETVTNSQGNNYDTILENAQRTVFLKELFSQVDYRVLQMMENHCLF